MSSAMRQIQSMHIDARSDMQVAPFALLRIAALPYECLEALRLQATEACIERLLDAERAMSEQQEFLEQVLFEAVPRVSADDASLRRFILKLRRDLHNRRAQKVAAEPLAQLNAMLEPGAQRALGEWTRAHADYSASWQELPELLQTEIQTVLRPALRAPLQRPLFRRALAFASAGVERGVARERKLPNGLQPDNLERSLLGYLARAAGKTSPFSSFMTLAVIDVDPRIDAAYPHVEHATIASEVYLNRGVVSRLHRQGLAEALRHDAVVLRVNPTLRTGANGRLHGLCDREVVLLGRPWCEQRWAQFHLAPALLRVLHTTSCDTWSGWSRRFADCGLTLVQIEATLLKLAERGLLKAQPPADAFSHNPLQTLASHWSTSRSQRLSGAVAQLRRIDEVLERFPRLAGETRIEALQAVRDSERVLLQDFGAVNAEPFDNLVLEDCWFSGIDGKLGRRLLQPLGDLQQFLATQVIESPYYERMRQHFIARYGVGGECTDVVGFLLGVADKLVDIPEFGARMRERVPTPAPDGVMLPATVHVQVAAGERSSPAFVVNRVFDGAGWLAARFTMGAQADQQRLRERLSDWLVRLSGDREPVDVVLGGHCSDLQAHAPLTPRVLGWPGEPLHVPSERIVPAETLRLRHNRVGNVLEAFDAAGASLNLVYLGATFPSPIWGLRYALSILTQPYLLARPTFDPPRDRSTDAVTFEAAIRQDSLVLRRATWWLPAKYLQRAWFAGSPAERLVNVRRECRRYGIPEVCFAQRYIAPERTSLIPADVLNANRKPLWVDLRNPFWLAMLERMAQVGDWIFLTEPLPSANQLWLEIEGKAHVSEVHLELMIQAATSAERRHQRSDMRVAI